MLCAIFRFAAAVGDVGRRLFDAREGAAGTREDRPVHGCRLVSSSGLARIGTAKDEFIRGLGRTDGTAAGTVEIRIHLDSGSAPFHDLFYEF